MEKKNIIIIDYVLFTDDISFCLESAGYRLTHIHPQELSIEKLKQLCVELNPAFIFTINFTPEIALIASMAESLYISWTIDPIPEKRFELYPGTRIDDCILFSHQQALVDKFSSKGFGNSHFLPVATPENRRRPIREEEKLAPYRCGSSFVGQSQLEEYLSALEFLVAQGMGMEQLKQTEQWMQQQFPTFDDFRFHGFEQIEQLPEWMVAALPNLSSEETLLGVINGWASYILRTTRAALLTPSGMITYGDQGWENHPVDYKGFANHGEELTCIYNASTVNVDFPRIYQRDIITMRVFDVMASGGLVVTESTEGIESLFKSGRHILTYRNSSELQQIVEHYSEHPEEAETIRAAGQREVMERHLMRYRVDEILHHYQRHISSS